MLACMAALERRTTPSSHELDLSGWTRRDEARARDVRQLLDRVETARGALVSILVAAGVTEAWIFGSVAHGTPRPESDVDMAVAGCPPDRFYRLAAELERALALPLDLVDLDHAPSDLAEAIRTHGLRIVPPLASHDQK